MVWIISIAPSSSCSCKHQITILVLSTFRSPTRLHPWTNLVYPVYLSIWWYCLTSYVSVTLMQMIPSFVSLFVLTIIRVWQMQNFQWNCVIYIKIWMETNFLKLMFKLVQIEKLHIKHDIALSLWGLPHSLTTGGSVGWVSGFHCGHPGRTQGLHWAGSAAFVISSASGWPLDNV